jgi:hypothetical protein
MTDFGADHSFMAASAKLKEHYGIDVPASAVRDTTEDHGAAMLALQKQESELPEVAGVAVLITEMDGSLVPTVETAAPAKAAEGIARIDRRKTRKLSWTEARLCLAHQPGSVTPIFGATMGSVDDAGDRLWECAIAAGAGRKTELHGLGDGAVWITNQIDLKFGTQATYLVDFYHLCEYLSAAASAITAPANKDAWMEEKKNWLKDNRSPDVLEALLPFLEAESIPDEKAPVRACHRYISNRTDFLDYKGALAAGLPIGSGEIESAHRYVIQVRIKIAGAWWSTENLSKMLALRVVRVNGTWQHYWGDLDKKAA